MNPFLAFLTNKKKHYVDLRAVPMARLPACDLSQYTAQKVWVFCNQLNDKYYNTK